MIYVRWLLKQIFKIYKRCKLILHTLTLMFSALCQQSYSAVGTSSVLLCQYLNVYTQVDCIVCRPMCFLCYLKPNWVCLSMCVWLWICWCIWETVSVCPHSFLLWSSYVWLMIGLVNRVSTRNSHTTTCMWFFGMCLCENIGVNVLITTFVCSIMNELFFFFF